MNKYRDALKSDLERAGGDLISLIELGVLEAIRFDDGLEFKINAAMFEQFYGDDYEVEPISWSGDRCYRVHKHDGCKVMAMFRRAADDEDA